MRTFLYRRVVCASLHLVGAELSTCRRPLNRVSSGVYTTV